MKEMTAAKKLITHGHVVDPKNHIDQVMDIAIEKDRIVAVGDIPADFEPDEITDARDCCVFPGLVDLAADLREPGNEHKGTIASETLAAASSGITTLLCPPHTTPPLETPADIALIRRLARAHSDTYVHPLGALTLGLKGKMLTDMAALKASGCVGISNGNFPVVNTRVLRHALEYAASHDFTVYLQPQDTELTGDGCAHEGPVATRLGLPSIPAAAETAALSQQLELVAQTGARTHFCRISTARSVKIIQRAKKEGLPISADVSAHQLFLTEMDTTDFNSLCRVMPPLRSQQDRDALREGVRSGVIDAIVSDHQPHDLEAKLAPFPSAEPGISAVETLLPLTLRLVEENLMSLSDAVACVTSRPANILPLDVGHLTPGAPADLCIIDPELEWDLEPEKMISQGKNSPFAYWWFKGRVIHTLCRGRWTWNPARLQQLQ